MNASPSFNLEHFPVHLARGGAVVRLPRFTGDMAWYQQYGMQHGSDGIDGRLVSLHSFAESWTSWEMHPAGDELVCCIAGRITLHQERADGVTTVVLEAGDAIVNPPGVWHTADVDVPCTALFITVGLGTEQRPRG